MTYYGYAGKNLYVDLTTGRSRAEPLDMDTARKFLGGCGIGERLLFDILKPGTDPLSPDAPLVISAGPLTGTTTPGAAKMQMITKTPVPAGSGDKPKHYVAHSSGGSHRFGAMMKSAGYDNIVITGRAPTPVYLLIDDEDVRLCDASDLWGQSDLYDTAGELMGRHKGSGVIPIGRGGENMVVFALSCIDGMGSIGRDGGAAVMGSKNLKAIVVHGTKAIRVAEPERLRELAGHVTQEVKGLPEYQAAVTRKGGGGGPWLGGKWNEYYPPQIHDDTLTRVTGCARCALACKRDYTIPDGEFAGHVLHTSAFGLTPIWGRRLELTDYRQAMELVIACGRLGICLATALGMARLIVRLYERGVLSSRDVDGLELKTGDFHSYRALIEKVASREGIGDVMAWGWYAIADRFGVDVDTDPDSDGIEKGSSTLYDARFTDLGPARFHCAVNPRGGMHGHLKAGLSDDAVKDWARGIGVSEEEIGRIFTDGDFNDARLTRHHDDIQQVYFALGICKSYVMPRQVYDVKLLADVYAAATGIELAPGDLKRAGERIWNQLKMLNVREGFGRADDRLPGLWGKIIDEPVKSSRGDITLRDYSGRPISRAGFEKMLDDYYSERGWDTATGIPTREKLAELRLEELAARP